MKWAFLILLGLVCSVATAQEVPINTRQQLEALAELREEEPEDDALLQQLHFFQKRPLNLNSATAEDLQLFPFLTPLQIDNFLKYRTLLGPLIDLHELQSIPSWNLDVIRQMMPYVQVQPVVRPLQTLGARLQGGEHQLLLRSSRMLQKAKGYQAGSGSQFAGDPYKNFLRYQYRHPEGLQWGISAEKDAGETFLKKGTTDHLSAHLFMRRVGKIKALALGDFTVNMGQGLVHWQALAFGKGPSVLAIKRQSPVLRPHSGAGEAYFLRGAGITLEAGRWEWTLFAAAQKIHANTDINEWGEKVITSFSPGGLHRTPSEMAHRKAARQTVLGGNLQYRRSGFSIGFSAGHYHFSLPIQKQAEPYNLFALQGSNFLNLGTDYSFTWRNLHLFGEVAANGNGKLAAVQGALLSLHPNLDLSLHGRAFHRGYTAPAADAFAEGTKPANEQGVYSGIQFRAHPQVTFSAYADAFKAPWLRYRVNAPSAGTDYLVQVAYHPHRGTELYARFRSEQKERNAAGTASRIGVPMPYTRQNLRVHIARDFSKWALRSRAEMVWYGEGPGGIKETGFLWYGEVQYNGERKLDATARLAFFETGSYNSRLYAYESDVLYGYSIPALFGKGLRGYVTARYRLLKDLSLWLRLAHNFYQDQQSIGTGLNETRGNQRTEVKCQILLSFK